jgi:hypothetical protein
MKITKIVKLDKKYNSVYNIYEVSFEPTWLENLFGIKAKTKQYRETGYHYNFNGVSLYINQIGKDISCVNRVAKAIDYFKNSW